MKKKRKYIYLEKCLIIRILQIYIFSFYDFLFFISLSSAEMNESFVYYKVEKRKNICHLQRKACNTLVDK